MKILIHLRVGHHEWIEDRTVKTLIANAKHEVQQALKPGQNPGGSQKDNEGISKVSNYL